MKYLVVFCLAFCAVFAKHELYDGHAVYEINVNNVDEIKLFHNLANELSLDIWSYPNTERPGQILVPESTKNLFEDALKTAGLEYKIEVENIKELLELEDQKLAAAAARSNRNSSRVSFDSIYTFDEVDAYIEDIAKKYPDVVSLVVGGTSVQGKPIKYLRISTTNFQDTNKPIVIVQSLLHAREWVTLPASLYAINKLVVDVSESDLVQDIDWIILPVANPDGYIWSHTNARFWRKNRRTGLVVGDVCLGVDLNRNFDFNWGGASSSNVCSETFHGAGPLSEPETQVISNIFGRYRNRIALYADIHSFGSMILYGFGDGTLPPNALVLNLVAVRMAQAIDRVKWPTKRNYIVGNVAHILYLVSGGSSDYATIAGIPFAYTFELPAYRGSSGLNGFLVDPDFIEQAGFETWEGIKAGARYIVNNFRNLQ